ncbi:MAG TPA: carboxypeptidase regulatory-like domain-containing protein [Pyrinomonadaceae bacterium]|nr:carboxypeptidase regulatory-like domain-containing protein [Pyrinomonadaceae bacterium]
MIRKFGLHVVVVLLGVGLLGSAMAQTSTVGSISGRVRDPQGGAVPKAEVVIREETTGQERTVRTDEDGDYSAQSLPVGRYSVSVTAQGFKTTVATGVEVHVADRLVVDLTVEVGQVTETVTVTGAAQTVETESGKVSSLVTEKQINELPLNGRNYAALVTLVPGLSAPNEGGAFGTRGTGLDSHVDVSVNGNQSNANMWTVDGVNNMDVGSNATLLVFPSIDSIAEFRVERNSFSAEYGQAQGAVINLVTKGGGNEFHGSLFEFFRNDKLNANDWFSNQAGIPRPPLRYNNFGGNFNGPIVKNRAFFFWSEEWRRERRGTGPLRALVPTAQERAGNFSGPLTGGLPFDPLTCTRDASGNRVFSAATCQPFPGNIIPQNRLSPAGLALMNIFPLPNNVNDPTGRETGANWISTPLQPVNTRQDLIRGDVTITDRMNLMVRYINETWVHGEAAGNFWGDTPFPTLSSDWEQPSRSFAVKLTNTLSSTAVNEFQFSRAGNDIFVTTSAAGQALQEQVASAFPTVFPRVEGTGFPTVGWGAGGYGNLWHQAPWTNHQDLFIWKDDFSKVFGSHNTKYGVLFSHNIKDEQPSGGSGIYTIQTDGSRTGSLITDLLLRDLPILQYTELQRQDTTPGRWHDFEFYANDTWKVHPRLTLTLGMRYSFFPPAYADNDRMSNWIPERFDGVNLNSGYVRATEAEAAGLPRALVNAYKGGVQPRVGLAWDIKGDGKTAIRMGFGRYISRSNVIASLLRMSLNPPWTTQVDTGWNPGAVTLADCPTCRTLDNANATVLAARAAEVGAVNSVDPNFRPPESWQWNLTVSREIMPNTVAEVSYVGNHGLHIWRLINGSYNAVRPEFRAQVANGADANTPGFRRFNFSNAITRDESTGDSSYHAMQVWIDRRFSNRLAFQTAYTWSHTISNVPTQSFISATTDVFNYNIDRGDADLDRRHSLVFNAVYALPGFREWGSVASKILGDWQLNGIASFYSGTPLNIILGTDVAGLGNSTTQRPNLVPGVPLYLDNGNDPALLINRAAFATPARGTFGNLPRGFVRAPGIKNVDFSVAKNWRFRERYGLQFRAEMFNVFNFVNFRGHNASVAGGGIENNLANGGFGRAGSTRGPREIQFGMKVNF